MRILVFSLFLLLSVRVSGQALTGDSLKLKQSFKLGGTANTFNSKAAIEVNSTSKYVLLPRMTGTEKGAISSPDTGALLFDTTANAFQYFNGTTWAAMGFASPMTTNGDLITQASGIPARIAIGTSGFVLTSNGTAASWLAPAAGFTNPMTTLGDTIVGGASGVATRLGIGTTNQIYTSSGTSPQWSSSIGAAQGGTGQTTYVIGDTLYATTTTALSRLAIGATNRIYTSTGTAPQWVASLGVIQGGTGLTATTAGGIYIGTSTTTMSNLAIGTTNQVLTSTGTAPAWRTLPDGGNFLLNPGFEIGTTSWTASGGTLAAVSIGTSFQGIGSLSGTWDSSAAAQTLTGSALTIGYGQAGANGIARCRVLTPSGTSTLTFGTWDGTTLSNTVSVPSSSTAQYVETTFVFGAQGTTIAPRFTSVASNEPLVSIDDCSVIFNPNISSVAQASFYGGAQQDGGTNCTYSETTSSAETNYVDLSTAPSCASTWTSYGGVVAIGTTSHQITMANMPPGNYEFQVSAAFYMPGSGQMCNYKFSDGTQNFGYMGQFSSGVGAAATGFMAGRQDYSTSATRTFKIQASDNGANSCEISNAVAGRTFIWRVWRFPTVAETITRQNQPQLPTQQRLTASSGTYTKPAGVTYIRVRMVGGGGGGSGSGTSGATSGGNGGDTTFAGMTAGGGVGGTFAGSGPAGGTASLGSVGIGFTVPGGRGGSNFSATGAGARDNGGFGGDAPFFGGGGRTSDYDDPGNPGSTNTGGGGQGGGGNATGNVVTGTGGSSGAYIEAYVYTPNSSYSYTVGSAGSAGAAGASGIAGGAGGTGIIIVDEYYGTSAPVIVGSVTTNSNGAERTERAVVTVSNSAAAVVSQSGSWISVANGAGAGLTTATLTGFTSAPACDCTVIGAATTSATHCIFTADPTSTTLLISRTRAGAAENGNVSIKCMGGR